MKIENFSPTYFLSALGAGGLAVSFYIYILFMVSHPSTPLATFEFIMPALMAGNWLSFVVAFCLIVIIGFSFLHFKLLILNTKAFNAYKNSDLYFKLKNSNSEVSLMAIPLTFAMTINVCFVLGAALVPGLWDIVEYLFPFALIGFGLTGYYALKIFAHYFARIITDGSFDFAGNNNLGQMISIFAFSMVGVGFAAPGAMSHYAHINAMGIFFAIFFITVAVLLIFIKLTIGLKSIFRSGINKEASPTLWIMIPILTLIGITLIRIQFGLTHHFQDQMDKIDLFILTSGIFSLQIIFGLLGFLVMKKIGYFEEFIHSSTKSATSFALICPGVAFMVFGMFFINYGLVFSGIIDKFSFFYFILMLPFIYVQLKTVQYFIKLNNKFFRQ